MQGQRSAAGAIARTVAVHRQGGVLIHGGAERVQMRVQSGLAGSGAAQRGSEKEKKEDKYYHNAGDVYNG